MADKAPPLTSLHVEENRGVEKKENYSKKEQKIMAMFV